MPTETLVARGRLLTMAERPIDDGMVVVSNGRVVYAGNVIGAPRVAGPAIDVELGDGTIIPGLIDTHVHLVASGGPYVGSDFDPRDPELLVIRSFVNLFRTLQAGITAIRDLAAPGLSSLSLRNAVTQGWISGPDIAAAGPAMTVPGGHLAILSRELSGAAAVGANAEELLRAGVDGLTLIATGQMPKPDEPKASHEFTSEELEAATSVATRSGMWVAAHALGPDGVVRAVRAGATTIERGTVLDQHAVEVMASKGASLVPTRAWVLANSPDLADRHAESIRLAVAAGVPVAMGTDGGASNIPHCTVANEASLLVDAGVIDNVQALEAATSTAADLLRRADLGRLVEGAIGHLLVLEADPLDDIEALRRVSAVVCRGRVLRFDSSSPFAPGDESSA